MQRTLPRFLVIMALAGAMIAGACSSGEPTTLATDGPVTADGGTDDTTSTEFDPVDAEVATPTPAPAVDATAGPTTTPRPPVTPTPVPSPAAPRPFSLCPDTTVPRGLLFVWDVADDDPDGGLVAHTEADVDSPIARVLAPNALAARPTGNCKPAPNGAPWFELFDAATGQFDWVNARYLAPASPACLHGEAAGGATRAALAAGEADTQLFGPLPGVARADGDLVAFLPNSGQLAGQAAPTLTFRWFAADSITINVPCFLEGATGPVCLSGTVLIFDFLDHSPRVNSDMPIEVTRTGRLYARPAERGLRDEFVEITLDGDPGRYWYDPATTRTGSAPCPTDGSAPVDGVGAATFDTLACTVGWEGTDASELSAGSELSNVDHVHDMTSSFDETNGCLRLMFTFGTNAWTDDDRASNSLIEMTATKAPTTTTILWGPCGWSPDCPAVGAGFDEPTELDIGEFGVRAMVARSSDGDYAIEVLHPPAASNVSFRENPARVVLDLALTRSGGPERLWYGVGPTVAERLPTDIPANVPFTLRGWDRPFEAQGQWRIYRVDDLISFEPETPLKLDNYAESDLELVDSGLYMTAGWTDAWGAFEAQFPGLEPGIYAVLVGSISPRDEAPYLAAGQVVRVYDQAVDPAALPELSAQRWDSIAISD